MTDIFDGYIKKKEYLVCIDSDGCAMDTMDSKHFLCFGPCMIQEWELELWKEEIQTFWNQVNLYTMTRGINRFKGLVITLKNVDEKYRQIEGLEELVQWTETATELSNASLVQYMELHKHPVFAKTLHWSEQVNIRVEQLPEQEKLPFEGAGDAIRALHEIADVAVVSSANQQAIMEEWETQGLLAYTDIVLSQDAGTKGYCIKRLLEKGYDRRNVLMIGDAPGDRAAADENGVLYYPILVKQEKESWNRILKDALEKFQKGTFAGTYQEQLNWEFEENLA